MRLEGKNAWITGAGSGIGAKIAEVFAREGANIAINDVNGEAADRTAATVRQLGRKALVVAGDVTNYDLMTRAAKSIIDTFGQIHILVNNAGIAPRSEFKTMTPHKFDAMMQVHIYGVYNCARAVVNHMLDRKYGRIITISSMSGIQGDVLMVHYSAAKAAQIGFTMALSKELCPHGITVNCVAPGLTLTPLISDLDQAALDRYAPPVGRLGMPEDQAQAALYFASDESSFVTGQTLRVSGGIG